MRWKKSHWDPLGDDQPKRTETGMVLATHPAPNFLQNLEDYNGSGSSGAPFPRWARGTDTKGRRTAETSLNKDWVGGGLSLRTPPPAAPAEHRPSVRRVERAWRGLRRRCYRCSCISGAWRWPHGVSRGVLGVPQVLAQPSRPSGRARPVLQSRLGCAFPAALVPSPRPPRRWASRVGAGRPDRVC